MLTLIYDKLRFYLKMINELNEKKFYLFNVQRFLNSFVE
jgi:hypothetical protein